MLGKVLILSASAGAGHLSAAEALRLAFEQEKLAEEVRHVDVLQYTNKVFRTLYSKTYLDLVNRAPQMLGWLYDYMDRPWFSERERLFVDKLNARPFLKMLQNYRPDLVVCTHFLPAELVSWLREEGRIACRHAVIVTDFDVHAMWLCRSFDAYFVAMEETRVHLCELGLPAEKIQVSGIPINPIFACEKDKLSMRRKLGLAEPGWLALVSAGGFGVGPIEHLVQSLMKMKTPLQVVALCGRSAELHEKIEALARSVSAGAAVRIAAQGYTTAMDEFMSAADLMIGKPGGLTTSEALAKGLVFVVVNPIPGQEERNSDHLLEEGAAIRCNNLPALAYKLDRLLGDESRMAALKGAARSLGRPQAALEIVRRLSQM